MPAHLIERDRPAQQHTRRAWCLSCLLSSVPALAPAQPKAELTQTLRIVNGALTPDQRLIKVYQGDRLRWHITSNAAGALHLHAYRLSLQLQAGQMQELAFTAFASGRFRVEWHAAGEPAPAAAGHHAPALAMLEVQPR